MFAIMALMAFVADIGLRYIFPGNTTYVHLILPLFFAIMYSVALPCFGKNVKPREMVRSFMILKGVRIIVSLALAMLLAYTLRSHAREIAVAFMFYYSCTLLIESLYFMYIKRNFRR